MLSFQFVRLLKIRFNISGKNLFNCLCLSFFLLSLSSSARAQQCTAPPSTSSVSAVPGPGYGKITLSINIPGGVDRAYLYASGDGGTTFNNANAYYYGPNGVYTYTATGLDTNKTYQFYVVAYNDCGSTSSGVTSATTLDIDTPSISGTAGPGYGKITLSINIPGGVDRAYLYASGDGGTTFNNANAYYYGPNGVYTYTATGLDTNKTYQFYVVIQSGTREKRSSIFSETSLDIDVPTITATAGANHKEITFSTDIPAGADRAFVYISYDGGVSFQIQESYYYVVPGTHSTTRTGLDTNKTYQLYSVAISGTREKQSGIVSATTRDIDAPTITPTIGPRQGDITLTTNIATGVDQTIIYMSYDNGANFQIINAYYYGRTGTFSYTLSNMGANNTYKFYAVSTSGSREKQSEIVSVSLNEDQDAGVSSCYMKVGKPVNVMNGNMYLQQADYNLPSVGESISLTRTYNSIIQSSGLFGRGWATQYDEIITVQTGNNLRLALADGRAVYFSRTNTGTPFLPTTPGFYGEIVLNADNTYTLTYKDGRVHGFGSGGRLLRQTDRDGNQTTLAYDANGDLAGITDSFGRTLTVTTNLGYVTQISDSLGIAANYLYNTDGTLQSVTYADGSKYKYEYDSTTVNGKIFLKTVKDALDQVLETHAYDAVGRATTSETSGGVEKYTLDYANANDAADPYTIVTDALGRITKYHFRAGGRSVVTKVEGNCGCGSGSQTTNYQYDNQLNIVKKVDALGRETVYTYDSGGNRLTQTGVLGTETYTYNAFGEVLTRSDKMNGVTTNTYNAAGDLLTTKDALNNTTTLTYNPRGQITTAKDARNNTTTLTYDTFGRLTQIKDANLKLTTYTYDARARILTMTNALDYTTTYGYDLANRVNKITYPDLKFVEYVYDLAGRRTSMKDERGNITTFDYDAAYRLISTTDALLHTTTFGYDLMSNRTSQTDALTNITNYEYDNFDKLKKIVHPAFSLGGIRLEERLEYDANGNVKKRIDTANRETVYDYDAANRLIKTTDANLQTTQFEYNVRSQMTAVIDALLQRYEFTYDALGRQLSQTKAGSTMSYEYDAVGNRTKRTDYLNQITNYTYDNLNRLTNINYPDAAENVVLTYDAISQMTKATKNAQDVTFAYDKRRRATSTTDVYNKIAAMTYDAGGNRTALKLDGVNFAIYAYDVADRLTKITNSSDAKAVDYTYDNADRMTKETLPNGIATTFAYDGLSRLTKLKDAEGTTTLFDRNYSYNPANQISQIAETVQTRNFGYDNLDRLTNVSGSANETYNFDGVGNLTSSHLSTIYNYQPNNRLSNTSSASYVYNSNGNLTSKTTTAGTTQFYWDYENRLKQVMLPSGQNVVYKYDALGRRIERNVNGTSWTRFTYDGQDVMLDQNSDGTSVTYLNGAGIDNKIRQTVNGQAQYFLTDHLGSTNALTDATGNIIASNNYDSFGNASNVNFPSRYQYTGREYDGLTGLNYYRARWYDANLGRFISEDPIEFKGGDINIYSYVGNQPLKFRDPSGMSRCNPYVAALLGGVAGGASGALLGGYVGAGVGALVGGGGGTLVAPGVGTVGGGLLGGGAGATIGAGLGGVAGAGLGGYLAYNYCIQDDADCDTQTKAEPKAETTPQTTPTPKRKNCNLINEGQVPNRPDLKLCIYKCRLAMGQLVSVVQYANLSCPEENAEGWIPRPIIPGIYPPGS